MTCQVRRKTFPESVLIKTYQVGQGHSDFHKHQTVPKDHSSNHFIFYLNSLALKKPFQSTLEEKKKKQQRNTTGNDPGMRVTVEYQCVKHSDEFPTSQPHQGLTNYTE